MKPLKVSAMSAAIASVCFLAPAAIGSATQRVGGYDFSYLTTGERRVTPVQVFDDGKNTYFQFRAGDPIPAIFASRDNDTVLLVPSFEGPYVKVSDVAGRFTLQLGRAQAQVVYGGADRPGTPIITEVSATGIKTPFNGATQKAKNVTLLASLGNALAYANADSLDANSYATPLKGDRVVWKESEVEKSEHQIWFPSGGHEIGPVGKTKIKTLIPTLKTATSVTIVGRDDDSLKEGLELARANAIKANMVALGVDANKIAVKTGVKTPPSRGQFASDIRIETVTPTRIARPSATNAIPEKLAASREQFNLPVLRQGEFAAQRAASQLPIGQNTVGEDVPPGGFDFRSSDRNLLTSLRRWGAGANYQIVWDAPMASDAPITGDGVVPANSMRDAMEKVVAGLQRKGYDVQATFYSNRVIRFTGVTK